MRRRAFTLIELLVVIAIIAILAAILFPVFAKAREAARKTTCLSNMKQLCTGSHMYTQDYDEYFPQANITCNTAVADGQPGCLWGALIGNGARQSYGDTWQAGGAAAIQPYIKNMGVVWCPNQVKLGYGGDNQGYYYNFQWLTALPKVSVPAAKVMFMESYSFHDGNLFTRYCCGSVQWSPQAFFNIAFVDGHVKPTRLDQGYGAGGAAGWSSCSGAAPNANYVCSGTSPDVPDFK